jgi:hypothetical protein
MVVTVLVGIIGLRQGHYYKGGITARGQFALVVDRRRQPELA